MGKGDKKTAKGKRTIGSYGNTRKRKSDLPAAVNKPKAVAAAPVAEVKEPKAKKTTAAKKTTTKKATAE